MATSTSPIRRLADRLASPRVVGLPIAGAVVGSVMLLGSISGASLPDHLSVTATTPTQTNVAGPGTLTGLHSGDTITVTAKTSGPATDLAGITRMAICKPGALVTNSADLIADQGGSCTDQPLAPGTDASVQDFPKANQTSTSVDASIKVGAGSRTFTWDGGTTTVTCDSTHACDLWVQVATDLAADGSGAAFEKYTLNLVDDDSSSSSTTSTTSSGGSSTTSTTASSGSSTTSTTASGGSSTTSTTAHSGSSTTSSSSTSSTAPTGSSTTSTTLPSGTTVSATAQAGGTISVTSTGWKAGTSVKGTLQSDPVDVGSLTVDSTGKISGTYSVPATTPAGAHTLTLSGTGSDGNPRTIKAGVTVTAAGAGSTTSTSTTARSNGGGIPVTGGNALRVGLAGLLLAAGGYLFALSSRQRRERYGSVR